MGCTQSSTKEPVFTDASKVTNGRTESFTADAKSANATVPGKLSMDSPASKNLATTSIKSVVSNESVLDALRKVSLGAIQKAAGPNVAKVSSTLTFWRPSQNMEDTDEDVLQQYAVAPPGMEGFERRMTTSVGSRTCFFPTSQYIMRYSYATVCGWYPNHFHKQNQDAVIALENFGGDMEKVFFGVYDGHGEQGHHCSGFAKDKVPQLLLASPHFPHNMELAFRDAMCNTNEELREHATIDDYSSGTTAITALIKGLKVYVANVGDSRCVLATKGEDGKVVAVNMSSDHTPYRQDEMERVKKCGARVLTMQQVEGKKDPTVKVWGEEETADESDPPRMWLPDMPHPGTAFTRSIGDGLAETIGAIADPEVTEFEISDSTPFFVLASDGVFEFITSQQVCEMVAAFDKPDDACVEIARAAYQHWLDMENRVDDITIVVAEFVGVTNKAGSKPTGVRVSKPSKQPSINYSAASFNNLGLSTASFSNLDPASVPPEGGSPTAAAAAAAAAAAGLLPAGSEPTGPPMLNKISTVAAPMPVLAEEGGNGGEAEEVAASAGEGAAAAAATAAEVNGPGQGAQAGGKAAGAAAGA